MDSVNWELVKELFHAALERPLADREEFLRKATQDHPDIRVRVEALLRSDQGATAFADAAQSALLADIERHPEELVGEQVGRYLITSLIGVGGMGEVYAAHQEEPVRRDVAIKFTRTGANTPEVLARFHHERDVLAMLDHPYIANVYDADRAADGRPYFVMELVNGTPINEYADSALLSIEARIQLFLQVCDAVHHAHQKGVIHRDLKPSNIIVAEVDGKAIPKVIDFGIAKLARQSGLTHLFGGLGKQQFGTIEFMSPEQIRGDNRSVDVRSDIYALGVLLFQLLSGMLPYDPTLYSSLVLLEPPTSSGFTSDPPRLTTRLRSARDTLGDLATKRSTDARSLIKTLAGDLEWIVEMAIKPEPERRYGSVARLASDLEHFLRFEPISAGPPGTIYRVKKFVRRNRVLVTASAAIAVVTLSFSAYSLMLLGEARIEQQRSNRTRAFLQSILLPVDPDLLARRDPSSIRSVLDFASERIPEEFAKDPKARIALRSTIASSYSMLLLFADAARQLQMVLDDKVALGNADPMEIADLRLELARNLVASDMVERAAAELDLLQEVYRKRVDPMDIRQIEVLLLRAITQHALGDAVASQDLFVEASSRISSYHGPADDDYAGVLHQIGLLSLVRMDFKRGEEFLNRSLEVRKQIHGNRHPLVSESLHSIGFLHLMRHEYPEAVAAFEQAVEMRRTLLGPQHPQYAHSLHNLGRALMGVGAEHDARARVLLIECLSIRQQLEPRSPLVANTLELLAQIDSAEGEFASAARRLDEMISIREEIFGKDSLLLADPLLQLARARESTEEWPQVLSSATRALGILRLSRPDDLRRQSPVILLLIKANLRLQNFAEASQLIQILRGNSEGYAVDPAVVDAFEVRN